jgi:hypothetical protein
MCETIIDVSRKRPVSCPHPALAHCGQCQAGLCSGHLVECEVCNHFFCGDCIASHNQEHDRIEQRINQQDCQVA